MKNNSSSQPQEPISMYRWRLARVITLVSIAGIAAIAITVIFFATDKASASQTVLTAVLPLLAAWVSTVLAYYYSSESIEAATKSVKELMSPEEKLKTILAKDKMIKIREMVYFTYTDELRVQEMLDKLKDSGKGNRFPFLRDNKQPEFMLHKSAVDGALVELSQKQIDITKLTLKELFEKVPSLKELAQGTFGAVAEDATLADAKLVMNNMKNTQDVFVTDNGRKDGAVIGWITNVIIEESSKVQE